MIKNKLLHMIALCSTSSTFEYVLFLYWEMMTQSLINVNSGKIIL